MAYCVPLKPLVKHSLVPHASNAGLNHVGPFVFAEGCEASSRKSVGPSAATGVEMTSNAGGSRPPCTCRSCPCIGHAVVEEGGSRGRAVAEPASKLAS